MQLEARVGRKLKGASPYLVRLATAASATFAIVYLASLVLLWEFHSAYSMSVAAAFVLLIAVGAAAALAALIRSNVVALVVATQAAVLVVIGLITTWA